MDNHTKLATTLLSERGVTLLDAARLIRNVLDAFSEDSGLTPVQFCAKVISTGLRHIRNDEMPIKDGFLLYLEAKYDLRPDSLRDIRYLGNRLLNSNPELCEMYFSELKPAVCEQYLSATFAEMLGVKIPDGEAIDSISALKNFRSASALGDRKEIVLQGTRGKSIRVGDWKFIPKTIGRFADIGSGADPRDKCFAEAIVPQDSLYNLRQDPSETHNAISENPDIAKRLKERLTQLENLK